MRKILFILLLFPILAIAQSPDQNWVKTKTYKQPTTTAVATPTPAQAVTQVNYFDGLGRAIQQVAHAQSNTGKDIVTHIAYDAFGRVEKEFLPYANHTASLNYNTSAGTDVLGFYNTSAYENTPNPYNQKQLEASQLNRVFKESFPGNAWIMGGGNEVEYDYQANTSNEIKKYTVTTTWNSNTVLYDILLNDLGNYASNQLYKTIIKNENWQSGKDNTTEEFKNDEGQIVLKRKYDNNVPYDTYYVYDVFSNLTYVIPPAVSGTITQTILDNMCYQYKYDGKNRLVEKKLPGKQWEYIVYDKLNRVVATGPTYNPYGANAENNKGWMLIKYDILNRPVFTAWHNASVSGTLDRKALQTIFNNATTISESKTTSAANIDGISAKYTNQVSPTTFTLLSINYYDNYDYPNAPVIPSQIEGQNTTTIVKGLPTGSWVRILDVVGSAAGELNYIVYDTRYRVLRSNTKNYLGGYTQVDSKLDWSGKTLYTITNHTRSDSDELFTVKDRFEYSPQDRLTKHVQQITSPSLLPEQLLTLNTYDELGQLTSKNVGGTDITGAQALQKVDYSYNVRGWLKAINDVNRLGTDLFAFKINYNQKENGTAGLFNGNISETLWRTSADNVKRKYEYQYDDLNRLLTADYSKPGLTSTPNNYAESINYDKNGNITELTRYGNSDSDGMASANVIDDLKYFYDTNKGNVLVKVLDLSSNPQGFNETADDSDGINDQTEDYSYDENGNMTKDTNKAIESITYNHLNLPTKIVFSGTTNGTISYLYNALGQKVQKKVVDATTTIITDYLTGFQYKNAILDFFPHAEGYVKFNYGRVPSAIFRFSYVFNYTDHLGNIRVSYSKDQSTNVLKILEENHYYPFGLKHTNYNSDRLMYIKEGEIYRIRPVAPTVQTYKYKYNGKELQEELGLNMYDYGARNYDPALGRWMNMDPLAETSRRFSPYAYALNNPVYFIDPDGMEAQEFDNDWHKDKDGNLVPDKGDSRVNNDNSVETFDGKDWFVADFQIEEVLVTDAGKGFSNKDNGEDWFSGEDLKDYNDSSNGLGIGLGVTEQLWTAAIAQNYKSANNVWAFAKLTSRQQAWRTTNTLGKFGSRALTGMKVLGAVGGAIQVGTKIIEISDKGVENATVRDWADLGMNTAGLGAAVFLASNPVGWAIGATCLAYSIGTAIYDANNPQNP